MKPSLMFNRLRRLIDWRPWHTLFTFPDPTSTRGGAYDTQQTASMLDGTESPGERAAHDREQAKRTMSRHTFAIGQRVRVVTPAPDYCTTDGKPDYVVGDIGRVRRVQATGCGPLIAIDWLSDLSGSFSRSRCDIFMPHELEHVTPCPLCGEHIDPTRPHRC